MKSQVVQRYYGFMIGFITSLLQFDFAKPGCGIHRRRINEALADLYVTERLPARHSQFLAPKDWHPILSVALRAAGKVAGDFYMFGRSAFFALLEPATSMLGRAARRNLNQLCSGYQLDKSVVKYLVRSGWAGFLRGNDLIEELVSRAYILAGMPVSFAAKESRTCLVVMPFSKPFR